MATPEEIARKKLANMRTPIYAEGSPTVAAQRKMPGGAVAQGIGSFVAGTVADATDQAKTLGNAAVRFTGGEAVGGATNAVTNRLSADRNARLSQTPDVIAGKVAENTAGGNNQFLNLSPNTDQGKSGVLNVNPVEAFSPVARTTPQQIARNGLSNLAPSSTPQEAPSPVAAQGIGRNVGSGFIINHDTGQVVKTLGTQQDAEIDKNVGSAFQQDYSRFEKDKPQQIAAPAQSFQPAPTVTMPEKVQRTSGPLNTFTDIMREKAARQLERQDAGINTANANTAINAFQAEQAAAHGTAALNAQTGIAGMQTQAQQDIARMREFSPTSVAQAGNLNAQTTLHQQQAEQVQTLNNLNKEYNDPKTTPERRQQILAQTGKKEAPNIREYPTGQTDEFGKPIMGVGRVSPDGTSIIPLQVQGQNSMESIFKSRPDFKAAYDAASPEKKKLMMQQLQQRMAGQK